MRIRHVIDIDAPADTVWRLTEDVESWPATTPTVTSVERLDGGPMGVGSRARLEQPGQRPTVWTVTTFEPGRRFSWEAEVFGIRTEGIHEVTPLDAGCRNTLTLELTGRGSGVLGRLLGRRLLRTITTENEGFKRAAESMRA